MNQAMMFVDAVAWVRTEGDRVLCTRSRGKDALYLPGGKREAGESDLQTLLREVEEELTVTLLRDTVAHLGTFEAQAHGYPEGVRVRMACYTGDFSGTIAASGEIEEVAWLSYVDRDHAAPVCRLVLDDLKASGRLA